MTTPEQIRLARHALGLPNRNRRSYRNRFIISPDGLTHAIWLEMVEAGLAERQAGHEIGMGKRDVFSLTRNGAEMVLRPGETLDDEDFPEEMA